MPLPDLCTAPLRTPPLSTEPLSTPPLRTPPLRTPSDVLASAFGGRVCHVVGLSDVPVRLPIQRWWRSAHGTDHTLLERCRGATIDIGCGPGRMTYELMVRGHQALGIDVMPAAVELARGRGAAALERDVFDRVPGEGRWECALLADGNIGIGGDPVRLLHRARQLISHHGRVVVDVTNRGDEIDVRDVALTCNGMVSRRFRWAVVPAGALAALAATVSLEVEELVVARSRSFGVLVPAERAA